MNCLRFCVASVLLVIACAAHAEVKVTSAWIRPTVPGQSVAGAYLNIESSTAASLVGAQSPAAKSVEVHEMSMVDNVMKMRGVKRLELPAGKTVELKPGGYHLMLIDITRPLTAGSEVPITLTVEEKGGKKVKTDIKARVGEPPAGAAHGMKTK